MDSDSDPKTARDAAHDSTSSALEFTGERFTPECVREMYYEHWHRYGWARRAVAGLEVLDAACGEGYGSAILAGAARRVHGVDLSDQAIAHARARYRLDNLEFHAANCLELPFEDDRFDAVVSFETLEHLDAHDALLAEFRRVLKPSGFVLLSSPDKKTYSDDSGYDNPYHVRELYREQLEALVGRHFPAFALFGQKLVFHSSIWSLAESSDGAAEHLLADDDGRLNATPGPALPPMYYLVAAAAERSALPEPTGLSLFTDRAESVYAHYNEEIRKHIRAGELLAERDAEIERLNKQRRSSPLSRLWQRLGGRN